MASPHQVLCRERKKESTSACEPPGGTRLGDAPSGEETWAGVMSTGCRCEPRQGWACPQRGALEEARGPQLVTVRKAEMEMGWAGGSHSLSSVCQILCQVSSFINRYVLSAYCMPGSVLGARHPGVKKNSLFALLECISSSRGTRTFHSFTSLRGV